MHFSANLRDADRLLLKGCIGQAVVAAGCSRTCGFAPGFHLLANSILRNRHEYTRISQRFGAERGDDVTRRAVIGSIEDRTGEICICS